MCSSHLGSCLIRVSILRMQSLLCQVRSHPPAGGVRTQSSTSRGARWRSLGRRVKPATALAGADETGSVDQRWTLAVERPLGNEILHATASSRAPALMLL